MKFVYEKQIVILYILGVMGTFYYYTGFETDMLVVLVLVFMSAPLQFTV